MAYKKLIVGQVLSDYNMSVKVQTITVTHVFIPIIVHSVHSPIHPFLPALLVFPRETITTSMSRLIDGTG